MSDRITYTIVLDSLCESVGAVAAIIACKVAALDSGEGCEVSTAYFIKLLGVDIRTFRKEVKKLQVLGYIECKTRCGRGKNTIYKKGANMLPFSEEKGCKNVLKKGAKMHTINYNKSIVNNNAPVRDTSFDDLFRAFWAAFNPPKEHQIEFTRCAALFAKMDKAVKQNILVELQGGKRRKNASGKDYTSPYLYLVDYKPTLPIWRIGDPAITADMVDALNIVRLDGSAYYCKPNDLNALVERGAQVIK